MPEVTALNVVLAGALAISLLYAYRTLRMRPRTYRAHRYGCECEICEDEEAIIKEGGMKVCSGCIGLLPNRKT